MREVPVGLPQPHGNNGDGRWARTDVAWQAGRLPAKDNVIT